MIRAQGPILQLPPSPLSTSPLREGSRSDESRARNVAQSFIGVELLLSPPLPWKLG